MTQLKTYLVGWNFTDDQGKAVEMTPSAVDMLDPELADEMMERLRVFLAEVRTAREANPTGTKNSAQRSA